MFVDNLKLCFYRCDGRLLVIMSNTYGSSPACIFSTQFVKSLDPGMLSIWWNIFVTTIADLEGEVYGYFNTHFSWTVQNVIGAILGSATSHFRIEKVTSLVAIPSLHFLWIIPCNGVLTCDCNRRINASLRIWNNYLRVIQFYLPAQQTISGFW